MAKYLQLPAELERKILDYKYEMIHTSNMENLRPDIKTQSCFMKAKSIINKFEDANYDEPMTFVECVIENTTYLERFRMITTFDKCNCCFKHNMSRPGPMDYSLCMDVDDETNFPKNEILSHESEEEVYERVNNNNHHCTCICRSMSRSICRAQYYIEKYYNGQIDSDGEDGESSEEEKIVN